MFFQWFVAPKGRKVGSLKRRVRSQLARGEMKNCTPLWRKAHFQVKLYKTHQVRTTFGSWDVEKSARRCGAKHISKSKCAKHLSCSFRALLEVAMSKKCTPLWREAHFQVKMCKTPQLRSTFGCWDVEKSARICGAKHVWKSKCTKHIILGPLLAHLWREAHLEVNMLKTPGVLTTFGSSDLEKVHSVVARSTFGSQDVENTGGSDHFWRLRYRFAWMDRWIDR